MARFGMIADDVTGACDAGVQFARFGFASVVCLNIDRDDPAPADLIILNTESRNDPPDVARQKVERACRRLIASGAEIVYKKIDSTLNGNIAPEIEAAMAACGCDEAWLAPAFPAMGRTVVDGWLYVGGERRVHIPTLIGGAAGIRIRDAATQEHLAEIARDAGGAHPKPLLVGSAGLAMEVAPLLAAKNRIHQNVSSRPSRRSGPVVLFIGSNNPVTISQLNYLAVHRAGRYLLVKLTRGETPDLAISEPPAAGIVLSGGDTAALVCCALGATGIRLSREIVTGIPCGTLVGGPLDGLPVATKAGGFGGEDALALTADFLAGGEPL